MSRLGRLLASVRTWGRRRSFALHGLDLQLERYLDFDNGVFVEAGANNGIDQSNTWYFEKYRGWRGLLVEPIPELAQACRRNRPKCLVENTALVAPDYREPTIAMRYCNLMSVVKGALKSADEEEQHIRTGCACQKIEAHDIEVPARTLSAVLDEHAVGPIDLFSLDVEGFEAQALRGLDFERHCPKFLLVEARYRQDVDQCVASHYETVAELSFHDVLYRRKAA